MTETDIFLLASQVKATELTLDEPPLSLCAAGTEPLLFQDEPSTAYDFVSEG